MMEGICKGEDYKSAASEYRELLVSNGVVGNAVANQVMRWVEDAILTAKQAIHGIGIK